MNSSPPTTNTTSTPTTTTSLSSSTSTPLTPRVSELKQIWEATIRKHEESAKSSALFKRHSVATCITNTTSTTPKNNKNTPVHDTTSNKSSPSTFTSSISNMNRNMKDFSQSISSRNNQDSIVSSNNNNNYSTTLTTPSTSTTTFRKVPLLISSSNDDEHYLSNSSAIQSMLSVNPSELMMNNHTNNNNNNNSNYGSGSVSTSKVSQTILKFTAMFQKASAAHSSSPSMVQKRNSRNTSGERRSFSYYQHQYTQSSPQLDRYLKQNNSNTETTAPGRTNDKQVPHVNNLNLSLDLKKLDAAQTTSILAEEKNENVTTTTIVETNEEKKHSIEPSGSVLENSRIDTLLNDIKLVLTPASTSSSECSSRISSPELAQQQGLHPIGDESHAVTNVIDRMEKKESVSHQDVSTTFSAITSSVGSITTPPTIETPSQTTQEKIAIDNNHAVITTTPTIEEKTIPLVVTTVPTPETDRHKSTVDATTTIQRHLTVTLNSTQENFTTSRITVKIDVIQPSSTKTNLALPELFVDQYSQLEEEERTPTLLSHSQESSNEHSSSDHSTEEGSNHLLGHYQNEMTEGSMLSSIITNEEDTTNTEDDFTIMEDEDEPLSQAQLQVLEGFTADIEVEPSTPSSGKFLSPLSSSSTVFAQMGNVFKDVEIGKNEDYARYFRNTNFDNYHDNVKSILEINKKRMSKRAMKKAEASYKCQQQVLETYRKNRWDFREVFQSIGSKEFEAMLSQETYVDADDFNTDEFEQVSMNHLFEESERTLNPLYEEEFIEKNPLYEEEYSTTNPLFDPTDDITTTIYNFEDSERTFVERLKQDLPRVGGLISKLKQNHSKAFTGEALVNWIMEKGSGKFLRLDAVCFAQQMMDRMIFKNVEEFNPTFEDNSTSLYIFYEEYESKNTLNIDESKIGVFEPQASFVSVYRALTELGKEMKIHYDLSAKYESKPIFDYQAFAFSEHYAMLVDEVRKLQKVDPNTIVDTNFRKCFFMNIYNIMVLHALMRCGKPTNFLLRKRFFHQKKYLIGRYKLSLDDIAHGVLRGEKYSRKTSGNFSSLERENQISSKFKQKVLGTEDNSVFSALNNLRIPEFDPRIHFCLYRADMSSPRFLLFSVDNLEYEIEKATREYVQRETKVDVDSNTIHLSKIFQWFREDFAYSDDDIIDFVSKYLDFVSVAKIGEMKETDQPILLNYRYNTSLNIAANISQDDNKEVNIELAQVRTNPKLLPFFISYSEREKSEENILFWLRVENYKQIEDPDTRLVEARKIFDEFLQSNGERELNINRKSAREVETELLRHENNHAEDPIRTELFYSVQLMTELLMIDTYERFLRSDLYSSVVEIMKEEMKNIEIDTPRRSPSITFGSRPENVYEGEVTFKELQMRRSRLADFNSAPLTSRTSGRTPESPVGTPPTASSLPTYFTNGNSNTETATSSSPRSTQSELSNAISNTDL
ncbi:hypothetical protein C9374_005387 [Naegleria lovaniensis]|uniref:RGS domain-containing protein n=1 Tax=Naegleria lovaniensis TaxID=51637 RepID=A0AA88GQF1_NAELO|nr:uncharacterized protein C9374_005387 [Naegleria lovaniensis]KAG2382185.1 hypothetical protein C9374_005387 [Naegleria lovaniensis]